MSQHQREAVLQAVTRNFVAVTGRQPDAGELEQLVHAFMQGPAGDGALDAQAFVSDLEGGRAELYPTDRELSPFEKQLFDGYRGPGWNDDEFQSLTPIEQKYALAPGEHWDRQRSRDINLLQAFAGHGPDDPAQAGYGYAYGGFGASGPGRAPGKREAAMQWHERGDRAPWRRGDPNPLSPRNLQWFSGNYQEDDLIEGMGSAMAGHQGSDLEALGQGIAQFISPVQQSDNAVGNFYRVADLPVYAAPSYLQGEAGVGQSVADERLRAQSAKRFARVSPVLPGNPETPADRIRMLRGQLGDMESVRPLDTAKSHYLHTGRPMSIGRSIATDAFYNALDLTALASVGLGGVAGGFAGAARGAGKGAMKGTLPRAAAGAAAGAASGGVREAYQEGIENVPFVAPSLLSAFGRLSEPTYGDNSEGARIPVQDSSGELIVKTPEQRKAALAEAAKQRAEARQRLQAVPPVPAPRTFRVAPDTQVDTR